MDRVRFQRTVLAFVACSFLLNIFTLNAASKGGGWAQTTVYKTSVAIPGPIGQSGGRGADGLSIVGAPGSTSFVPQPIIVEGKQAEPCTVVQNELGETIITCPNGSSVLIPKAVDGKDGQNGDDGENGKQIQLRKNGTSGNLEYKYQDDTSWLLLYKKCEIQGTC